MQHQHQHQHQISTASAALLMDTDTRHRFAPVTMPARTAGAVVVGATAVWLGDADGDSAGAVDLTIRDTDFEGEQRVCMDPGQLRQLAGYLVALADHVDAGPGR